MTSAPPVGPDEGALRRALQGPEFRRGAAQGRWALEKLTFPYAYFRITAPDRPAGPPQFLLRADCTGYPAIAPTSALWDGRTDSVLAEGLRPAGANGACLISFTSGCGACLYHPIDRMARPHWPNAHHDLAWKLGFEITDLLECVHGLLDSSDYHRASSPEAAAHLPGSPVVDAA